MSPDGDAADALNRVARAADRIASLTPQLAAARDDLNAAIADAYVAGAEPVTLARTTGLSRQRIHQILVKAGVVGAGILGTSGGVF